MARQGTIRMRFKAISTDVRGLDPSFDNNLATILDRTGTEMHREFQKVTRKFHHANSPIFRNRIYFGAPPDSGSNSGFDVSYGAFSTVRDPGNRGDATYVMVDTKNDPIFYYLERGAKRYRRMSYDWMSLTKPYMGTRTFPRRGKPMGFGVNRYIEPRYFAHSVVKSVTSRFIRRVYKVFRYGAVVNFFGKTKVSS